MTTDSEKNGHVQVNIFFNSQPVTCLEPICDYVNIICSQHLYIRIMWQNDPVIYTYWLAG
jgi:hypothetical protein